jgi:hypothetical protein
MHCKKHKPLPKKATKTKTKTKQNKGKITLYAHGLGGRSKRCMKRKEKLMTINVEMN